MTTKWNNGFVESSGKKCVNIFKNGDFEHGKTLYLEEFWTFQDFLNAASQRLGLGSTATKMYSVDGDLVDDCMMVEDNDIVFLATSENQEFMNSITSSNDNPEGDKTISSIMGNYKVGRFLGKGGFGEVRIGEHQVYHCSMYIHIYLLLT